MKKILLLGTVFITLSCCSQITITGTSITLVDSSLIQPTLYCSSNLIIKSSGAFINNHGTLELLGDIVNSGRYISSGTEKLSGASHQTISGIFSDSSFLGSIIKQNTGNVFLLNNTDCNSVNFATDGTVDISSGITLNIKDSSVAALSNYSEYRHIDVGWDGHIKRRVNDTTPGHYYDFPMGNYVYGYKNFEINITSLGLTGAGLIIGTLIPTLGTISYNAHYPSGFCTNSSPWINFNDLSTNTWNFYGPDDYTYHVLAKNSGIYSPPQRVIQSAYGLNTWTEFIPNVICDTSLALCNYSDWSGTASEVPGGPYRGFSDFAITHNSESPLPVELTSFTAVGDTDCIKLVWTTVLEINNDRFIIMRSTDGVNFTNIGEELGHGTTTQPQEYSYTDCNTTSETTYYYQLRQIDFDNHSDLSPIVSAKTNESLLTIIRITNILGQELHQLSHGINIVTYKTPHGTISRKLTKW